MLEYLSIKRFAGLHSFSAIYIKQVGATTIIKGISVLISIIYVPLVLGYLDQEKYGIWVTLSSIVNWIRLLDIGMGNGMRNKLAEAIALNNHEQGRIFVSTTYVILGAIFIIFLLFFYLVNPLLNWQAILNTRSLSPGDLLKLTNIAVTFIVLGFIFQPVTLVYAAGGDTVTGGVVQLLISGITLLVIWFLTLFPNEGDLISLAWVVTGIPVVVYVLFTIYTFYKKFRQFRPSIDFVKVRQSGNLIKLSGQFFVVQITAAILFSSIPFVVTQLFSPNEVTTFNIASSIFNVPIMLMGIITAPGHSLITQSYAKNDLAWMRSLLKKQILISGIFCLGTVIMIIASPWIYKIWLGNKLLIPSNLSFFVGLYAMIQVLVAPFSTFINAVGRIKILVILGPISIMLFVGGSWLLSLLLNDVIAVSIALSIISAIGLFVLPLELRKILWRKPRFVAAN